METICDSLEVENRTKEQLDDTALVLNKLLGDPDYTADKAIKDMFVIYNIPDNHDTRKVAAEMFTLAASYETANFLFKLTK